MKQEKYFKQITKDERDNIRSLAGKLITDSNSIVNFNKLHGYCLDILDERGNVAGLFKNVKVYRSINKEIMFGVNIRYRESICADSLMLDYNESESIANHLHLMRPREKVGELDFSKSFEEIYKCVRPGVLRIYGTNEKYRIIKYN